MPKYRAFFGLLALIFAVSAVLLAPASAEFFGCNEKASHVLAKYSRSSDAGYTHEFAAQSRPRLTIHPRRTHLGRNAKRHCRSWLAQEYRVSGPVVVPQMRCYWD